MPVMGEGMTPRQSQENSWVTNSRIFWTAPSWRCLRRDRLGEMSEFLKLKTFAAMIKKSIFILCLLLASPVFASEPLRWITFSQGHAWSVRIEADGSAEILYGSDDKVETPAGSFDLKSVEAAVEPLVTTNPGLEKGVHVFNSRMSGQVITNAFYTENIDYVKELVEEVFEKSSIAAGNVERFEKWLEKYPLLGVQLYFDEKQIVGRERYTGPPIRLRKPPSWLTRAAERYPLLAKYPVALELFSTPWPYLALLILLGMGVRRWRLNRLRRGSRPAGS